MTSLTAAVVQQPPVYLNLKESIKKAVEYTEKAADQGGDIIIFPETWLPGYPVWLDFSPNAALWDYGPAKKLFRVLMENAVKIPDDITKIIDIAQKLNVHLVIGVNEKKGGTLYNTMVFIDNTGTYTIHRKLLPTYSERMVWGRGDGSTLKAMPTTYGTLGGLICWEHWMPLARAAMHAQYETIHIAQWPMVKPLHHIACRHYAFEGQCFVVAAGCIITKKEILTGALSVAKNDTCELLHEMPVKDTDFLLTGGSAIIAPDTQYVTGPIYDEYTIVYGTINTDILSEGHLFLDTSGHYARPDIFQLTVNDQPQNSVTFQSSHAAEFKD
ncbi:MAG: carbon-nitrogen hydrolase family protein [Candidatus Methanofastidiosia archaeon]|jgi:predicted amidohydrolase